MSWGIKTNVYWQELCEPRIYTWILHIELAKEFWNYQADVFFVHLKQKIQRTENYNRSPKCVLSHSYSRWRRRGPKWSRNFVDDMILQEIARCCNICVVQIIYVCVNQWIGSMIPLFRGQITLFNHYPSHASPHFPATITYITTTRQEKKYEPCMIDVVLEFFVISKLTIIKYRVLG